MSAVAQDIIAMVHAAGGAVAISSAGKLRVTAPSPLPPELVDRVRSTKAELLELLSSPRWDAEDWRAEFGERAGILEFEGGLPRAAAEALALDHCLALGWCPPEGWRA